MTTDADVRRAEPRDDPPGLARVLAVVGLVAVAINQRPAVASIGPVLGAIRRDLDLSGAAAAVLTAAPVVCFGVLAPMGGWLSRRLGMHRSIGLLSAVLVVGLIVRLGPNSVTLFAGTIIAAAGIAAMNVLLPALIGVRWPRRTGAMMGLYTTGVTGFAAVAAGLTVPADHAFGGGWRAGLAPWAVLAAAGLLGWLPQLRRPDPVAPVGQRVGLPVPAGTVRRELLRDRMAWVVTGYFAIQSAGFYAVLTWLPTLFTDHGMSAAHAGALLSLSAFVQAPVALVTPALAARVSRQGGLVVGSAGFVVLGFVLLLVAPVAAAYPAVILLGIGQGSSFPLALTILVLRAPSPESTTQLSSMAQTIGYLLAATGPLIVGLLHSETDGWTAPLLFLLATLVPQLACGVLAGRPRTPA